MGRFNSDEGVAAFALLVDELQDAGLPVQRGAMMGRPILKVDGAMFACLSHDAVGFKLGAGTPAFDAALAVDGASLFDPSLRGRPFKDWVSVPSSRADLWSEYALAAITHVRA